MKLFPDNPMYSSSDPNQRRIVASGLRNPYRFTFRPGTNEIWAGDVGERLVEEIDRIPVGDAIVENHGWPCYEGSPRQPAWDQRDFTICEQLYAQPGAAAAPFFTYLHGQPLYSGDTCSAGQSVISSIAFYQGGSYPDAYDGALFFGDYGRDCIWVMLPNAPNGGLNPSSVQVFFENGSNPVDIQVGPGGDLFFVDVVAGRVRRIGYFGGDQPPVASIDASPVSGPAPLTVNFDGSGSSDAEGGALTFAWDLDGDGAFDDASTPTASWTYETAADTTVGLRVTDPGGQTDIEHVVISVANEPPVPVIDLPTTGFTWHVGEPIDFSGHASDPDEGALPDSALSWSASLQHCDTPTECHEHVVQEFDGQASGSFDAPDHEYPAFLDLELTATDSRGLAVSTTVRLEPETTDVTMTSDPPGLQLGVGLTTQVTPFTHTAIVGSTQSITAPSPQSLSGTPYEFVSWSDGGARTHDAVVNGPTTFSATFHAASASTATVSDFQFQPKNIFPPIGGEVRWDFAGPSIHTVTDNTGMGLYDSGSRGPGSSYSFAFPAAGNYPFRCTIHAQMRGSVQIPVAVSPASGGVATPFSITWASGAPPAGYVYDVQVRRAGSSTWQYYRQGTITTSAVFTPDAGLGIYSFQARIRQVATGRAAAFSTPVSINVTGNQPPVPVIDQPNSGFTWHVGESVDFSGHASDPEDGSVSAASLSWDVVVQDCSSGTCVATPYQSFDGQASGSFTAPDYEDPVFLDLVLTATDSGGLAASTTVRLSPETADVTMTSNPPGLQLGIGSTTQATPFTHTVIVGSTPSITAPSPQSLGSTPYEFVSWSDGGAGTHDVVVDGPSTFSATFQGVPGNQPPVPVIDQPNSGFTWHVGESVDFSGHASDPEDGSVSAASLSWDVVVQDCSSGTCVATPYQSFDGQASGSFTAPDYEDPVFLDLVLTATDSGGLAASTTVRLSPETADVTMTSNPPGLQLGIGSTTQATPFTHTVIVGSTPSITAPSPQSLGSTPYEFVSWSDGGAGTHDVVVNGPSTFSATFQGVSVSMITVSDFQFLPKNVFPPIGGEVRWNFAGPSIHTATDNTGMGLYDSGPMGSGTTFSFAFPAAGNYPFRCTIHPVQMRGSVQIPVSVSPMSGGVGTPFTITWASGSPPSGYAYDVQIRRAGSSTWLFYRQGTASTSALFTPDAGVGTYSFQARIRQVATGRAAAFSTPVSITVT